MKKQITIALAAGTLLFAACGSESDGGGDGGGESQSELATMLTDAFDEAGLAYDADCISDKTAQLTDEDAEAIVAAGVDGDPEVSEEADAIGATLNECFDLGTSTSDPVTTD